MTSFELAAVGTGGTVDRREEELLAPLEVDTRGAGEDAEAIMALSEEEPPAPPDNSPSKAV